MEWNIKRKANLKQRAERVKDKKLNILELNYIFISDNRILFRTVH